MKKIFSNTIILCAFLISGCGGVNEKSPTAKKIEQAVRQGAGTIFEMKTMTDFQWDHFFVFEPYTLRKKIHETAGVSFLKENEIPTSVEEADCLLVFMQSKNVVKYFTYRRSNGDFDTLAKKTDGFTPDEAVFKVVDDYGERWKRIKTVR